MDAWEIVTASIEEKLLHGFASTDLNGSQYKESLAKLLSSGLLPILQEWYFAKIQELLRNNVLVWFWRECENASGSLPESLLNVFEKLSNIVDNYCSCGELINKTTDYMQRKVLEFVHAILFTVVPDGFLLLLGNVYKHSLKVFAAGKSRNEFDLNITGGTDDSCDAVCVGCDLPTANCMCEELLARFTLLNQYVCKIDSKNMLLRDICVTASDELLKEHVEKVCKDSFEKRHLSSTLDWLDTVLIAWLQLIWNHAENVLHTYKTRLRHNLYDNFARIMIGQLFSIVIEYPESLPVVQDLRDCLEKVNVHAHLVQSLRTAFETRLLHPGVKTEDIITAYISAIRVMKVLDSTGSLMNAVCEPIQQYLRSREDTVRCIVFSLTDNASGDISEELMHGLLPTAENGEDVEVVPWDEWTPDTVHVDSKYASSSGASHADIINMLVNIFGSRNVFVNEYFNLLADRILSQPNFHIEREIRYLELLKLRFGETLFQQGEIMVKDVSDSNRINGLIRDGKKKLIGGGESVLGPLDVLIISAQFWPQMKEDKLELPTSIKTAMEDYCKAFEKVKANRSLTWRPNLGLVDVEIELKGRVYNMQVSPLHAAILFHFEQQPSWTLDKLSEAMQVPAQLLQRKLTFWLSKGLIQEEQASVYVLNEDTRDLLTENSAGAGDDDQDVPLNGKSKKEEEEPVVWQYVLGMLRNFVALPLDRIHTMLKMFAMQGPGSDWTIGDLKNLLHKQVREQKLVFSGSTYRMPKE